LFFQLIKVLLSTLLSLLIYLLLVSSSTGPLVYHQQRRSATAGHPGQCPSGSTFAVAAPRSESAAVLAGKAKTKPAA